MEMATLFLGDVHQEGFQVLRRLQAEASGNEAGYSTMLVQVLKLCDQSTLEESSELSVRICSKHRRARERHPLRLAPCFEHLTGAV